MERVFFIVGPTATGKSEMAAEVARRFGAEIVSADAFQIYRGLDRLTAKPEAATLALAPHHLMGAVSPGEEMNVEKFRGLAVGKLREIKARGHPVIVVGGSGLYVKALTHGLSEMPGADWELRAELAQRTAGQLYDQLQELDPIAAERIDQKNKRRLIRAVEVCLLSGRPFSATAQVAGPADKTGVFLFRDRAELYQRIDRRVDEMFRQGVVEEISALGQIGATADKTIGFREILALLAGEVTQAECIAKIQQSTRRYAKRQLTWFQRQDNFEPLNLSLHGSSEAIELIAESAARVFANG